MISSTPNIKLVIAVSAIAVLSFGCQRKKDKIAQDITSYALNFYVLNQEVEGIRAKASSTSADQIMKFLPSYYELANRCQKMIKDNGLSKELNKHPGFMSAMDSCLYATMDFLILEIKAIETFNRLADVDQQLRTIRQIIRNNSLLAKKYKAKRSSLFSQQSKYKKQLSALKPKLNKNSQLCRRLLLKYNKTIMDENFLSYVNNEGLFDTFNWEKQSEVKKPSAKRIKK